MNLQYISDNNDAAAGVFIPIKDWNKFEKLYYKNIEVEPTKYTKSQLKEEIKEAVEQVNLIKQGKLKPTSFEDFINEL